MWLRSITLPIYLSDLPQVSTESQYNDMKRTTPKLTYPQPDVFLVATVPQSTQSGQHGLYSWKL